MSPSIFHAYGTLTGYFGPWERVADALEKQLRTASSWRRRTTRDILPQPGTGFQPATEIRGRNTFPRPPENTGSPCSFRYVTGPGIPRRDLSSVRFMTATCQSLSDLQNLGKFPGLTIIEDRTLVSGLKDDGPDMVGTLLREMTNRTGGIIVLGREWSPPVSDMDPYFDRVVWVSEIPMTHQGNTPPRPDYGQTLLCSE